MTVASRKSFSIRLSPVRLLLAGVLGLAAASAVHAEVWGYVDAKGVAHFSTKKVDDRYEMFFRGGQSFDTSKSPAPVPELTLGSVSAAGQLRMIALVDSSPSYKQVVSHLREASKMQKIDYDLLKALIVTESGFNTTAVSPMGAVGLMQIMPATAERYGVRADKLGAIEDKLTDPKTNIRTGTKYLRFLLDLFPGRLDLAVAAYNAGEGAVQRAGNKIPNYPETQNYVRKVIHIYNAIRPTTVAGDEPPRIGPERVRMELPAGTHALMAPGTEHILASSGTAAALNSRGMSPMGMSDVTIVNE
ncbi:MAG: lytic transglycosylase domain-containing protein [Burkholderiales bacterium]